MNTIIKENDDKNYLLALGLSYFLGSFGVDRYYLGKTATGVLKMLTLGGLGIWSMIDVFRLAFGKLKAKDNNLPLEGFAKHSKAMKMVSSIVLAIHTIFILGYGALIVFATMNGLAMRGDNVTYDNSQFVATSIQDYIGTYHTVPEDLTDVASSSRTANMSYRKDSDTQYTFCANYKHAGTVELANGPVEEVTSDQALYISATHKAGKNCQTISPASYYLDPLTATQPATSTVAAATENIAKGCGIPVVSTASTNNVTKTPTGNTTNGVAEYILTQPSRGGGLIWKITAETPVFDADCAPLDHSKVLGNDMVDIFTKPAEGTSIVGDPMAALVIVDHNKH